MRPFRRRGDVLVAELEPAEARIVALLLDQLDQLLTGCCPPVTAPTPSWPPTTAS